MPENLIVDEDGLGNANVDGAPLQSNPGETDSTESATDSGSVVVDFGDDVPADLNASIELVDNGALDGQLVDLDGNPVTFAPNGSGQLVGTANGVTVMIISITGAVAGPGAGEVTYTYSAQLLQPVQHADAGNNENSDLLSGVGFQVTDSDGDTDTGSFNVTVIDDVPSMDVAGPPSVTEGQTVNGTWTDVAGADQPGEVVKVVFGGAEYDIGVDINTGKGTLTVNADGTWSFTAVNNLDNDVAQSISFTLKITDADNDVATDVHTITINDGPPPTNSGPITLEVDDEALSSGTNAASNAEVDSDTITFTAGSDNLTVAFGISVAGLGGGLTWTRVNDTTIEGYDGGNLVVTLSLTGTLNIAAGANGNVTVTATLEENYDSHPGINVDDLQALGNVLVVGSDQDGESSSAQVNVGVSDDVPLVTTAAEDSELDPTTLTASGDFAFDIGADDFPGGTAEDYLTAALSGTVDGVAITVAQQPSFVSEVGGIATYEFTFTYDHDSDDGTAEIENGGTVAFDLVNGGYTVTLDEGFTSTEVIPVSDVVSRTGYNTEGSSPSQFEIVVSELDTTDPIFVQFTAIKGPSNNTFTADADGNPATGNSSFVAGDVFEGPQSWASISNTENGVAGDTIQSTDVLNIDFFNANPRNPDATPNPAADPITVEGLTLDLAKLGAGEDMVVILKLVSASDPSDTTTRAIIIPYSEIYTEGETLPEGYTGTLGNDLGLVVIEFNDFNAAGEDYVISGAQMIMSTQNVSGSGIILNGDVGDDGGSDVGNLATFASSGTSDQDVIKIVDIGLIRTTTTIQEVQLNFDVTVTDADGDKATDTFVINPDAETLAATSMLMSSMEPASDDASFSSLSFTSTNDNGKWNGASGNNFANVGNTGITSAMVAASGFAAMAMSSTHKFTESSFDGLVQDSFQQLSTRMAGGESLDEGLASISFGSDPGGSAVDAVNLSSSSFSFGDQDFGSRGLDAMSSGDAEPAYTPSYASGEPTVASIPALAANVPDGQHGFGRDAEGGQSRRRRPGRAARSSKSSPMRSAATHRRSTQCWPTCRVESPSLRRLPTWQAQTALACRHGTWACREVSRLRMTC